jgi:hypothetical protein
MENNKARRNEITKLKFKKRRKRLGLKQTSPTELIGYKHQAVPCSCWLCSQDKYKRNGRGKFKINLNE